jgi:hypothetical protein
MNAETPAEALKKDVDSLLAQLTTTRDQIRLEVHLASMDARDAWKKLEGDFDKVAELSKQVTVSSRDAATELLGRFEVFLHQLEKRGQAARAGGAPTRH